MRPSYVTGVANFAVRSDVPGIGSSLPRGANGVIRASMVNAVEARMTFQTVVRMTAATVVVAAALFLALPFLLALALPFLGR